MKQQLNLVLCLIYHFFKLNYVYSQEFKTNLINENLHNNILHKSKCKEIKIDYCKNVDYKETTSLYGEHKILKHLSSLELILKSNCSEYLQIFICSNFLPPCSPKPLRPCKEFCLKVKQDCVHILNKRHFDWPNELDCNIFPKNVLCIKPNFAVKAKQRNKFFFKCPIELRKPFDDDYKIKINNQTLNDCAMPCHNFIYTDEDYNLIRNFIGIISLLCFLINILSMCTFLIDEKKFNFPFRVIVYISCSYLIISVVYIFAYFNEDHIACTNSDLPYIENLTQNFQKIVSLPKNNISCIIVFVLIHFFTIFSAIWWLILGIICILEVFFMWANEAIKNVSCYFNLIAWILSSILTIITLFKASIHGDSLSGICSIDIYDQKKYLILPLTFFLIIGSMLIIFSLYYYYFQLKPILQTLDYLLESKRYFQKLFFAILFFFIPFLLRLICFLYELLNYDEWVQNWYKNVCSKTPNDKEVCLDLIYEKKTIKPNLAFIFIKYLSIFLPSFISTSLIFNRKSFQIWFKYLTKIKSACLNKKNKMTHL